MANIGTLTAQIGLNTKALKKDVDKTGKMFGGLQKSTTGSLGKIISSVGKLGAALGVVAGGAAVVGMFKKMISIGVQFEQSMAEVGGVMRASANEMENLTNVAKRMGETTEWSASQAADALKFLGMAGFKAAEAAEALPGVLDLATAGNLDLGRAADIASNALTAMGLPVKELTRVNDVFVGTITRSNTNMEQMAESFKYAAPVAKAYGYSVEDLSGLIGKLGDAGIQGSMAGTQLAMAIQKSSDIAKEFGFESSELTDVLERLKGTGMETTEIMKLFGLRAGRAVGVLVDRIPEVREFQETLRNTGGEATTLANIMRATVGGSFKELKSIIDIVAIDVFGGFSGSLKETVQSLVSWIRRNKDAIVALLQMVSRGVLETVKTVGKALKIVGGFIEGIASVFKATDVSVAETADSIVRSGDKMREGLIPPETFTWEGFILAIGNMMAGLEFIFKSAGALIGAVLQAILEGLSNVGDSLGYLTQAALKAADWNFTGALESLGQLTGSIKETGTDFVDTFQTAFGTIERGWEDFLMDFEKRSPAQIIADQFAAAEWLNTVDERTKLVAQTMLNNLTAAGVELKGTIAEQMQMAMVLYYQPVESASERVSQAILKSRDDFSKAMDKMAEDSESFGDAVQDSAKKTTEVIDKQLDAQGRLIDGAAKTKKATWEKAEEQISKTMEQAASDRETLEEQSSSQSIATAQTRENKVTDTVMQAHSEQLQNAVETYDAVTKTADEASRETTRVVTDSLKEQQDEVTYSANQRIIVWRTTEENISKLIDTEISNRRQVEQAAATASIRNATEREDAITNVVGASYHQQAMAAQTAFENMYTYASNFAVNFKELFWTLRDELVDVWTQIYQDMQDILQINIDDFRAQVEKINVWINLKLDAVDDRVSGLKSDIKWLDAQISYLARWIDDLAAKGSALSDAVGYHEWGRIIPKISPPPAGSPINGGTPQIAGVAAVQPIAATVPMAPAVSNIHLHFHGPVTSIEFVNDILLPAIEKAVMLEETMIARKTTFETGDANVIYG